MEGPIGRWTKPTGLRVETASEVLVPFGQNLAQVLPWTQFGNSHPHPPGWGRRKSGTGGTCSSKRGFLGKPYEAKVVEPTWFSGGELSQIRSCTSPRGPVAGSKNGVPGSLKPNSVSANLYKTLIGRPVSHMWTWLQRCFGPQTPTHRVPGLKSWVMGSSKFRQFPRSHLVFYNEPENSETYFQTDILLTIRIFYWGQSCSA